MTTGSGASGGGAGPGRVAILSASPVGAALARLIQAEAALKLELVIERATADHLEQAVGPGGLVVLDVPAGESHDLLRSLGARGLRVLDLGPDLRVPQIACALFDVTDRRVAALPSPGAAAAFLAARPLIEAGLVHPDRLACTLIEPADAATAAAPATSAAEAPDRGATQEAAGRGLAVTDLAAPDELAWLAQGAEMPPLRVALTRVRGPGPGLVAVVFAEAAHEQALDDAALRSAFRGSPGWVRLCAAGSWPDAGRVAGRPEVEVSVAGHGFAEFVACACALDPVGFTAGLALRAALQLLPG